MTNEFDIKEKRVFKVIFDINELIKEFPTQIRCKNKILLEQLHQNVKYETKEIEVSRWNDLEIPEFIKSKRNLKDLFEVRNGIYQYEDDYDRKKEMHWYKNFADSYLFVAFDRELFAQDEMQCAEHPILGHIAVALRSGKYNTKPLTVENKKPTPVLIQAAPRKIKFDSYNSKIYGNNFARASEESIKKASTVLNPPTLTNLVCIEAPPGGYGKYSYETIKYIFLTAYSAYRAIKFETNEKLGLESECILHTGFWGCGAFGGNHILMTAIQIIAADHAGIDKLIFYKFSNDFTKYVDEGLKIANKVLKRDSKEYENEELKYTTVLFELFEQEFKWNESDGN